MSLEIYLIEICELEIHVGDRCIEMGLEWGVRLVFQIAILGDIRNSALQSVVYDVYITAKPS